MSEKRKNEVYVIVKKPVYYHEEPKVIAVFNKIDMARQFCHERGNCTWEPFRLNEIKKEAL